MHEIALTGRASTMTANVNRVIVPVRFWDSYGPSLDRPSPQFVFPISPCIIGRGRA